MIVFACSLASFTLSLLCRVDNHKQIVVSLVSYLLAFESSLVDQMHVSKNIYFEHLIPYHAGTSFFDVAL
jgi:hypothetical protein